MNTHYAREQLAETCRQIGADFTYDEAEGEAGDGLQIGGNRRDGKSIGHRP